MTIFELITAPEVASYWETMVKDLPPYLGEELWGVDQKLGLDLKFISGQSRLPQLLNPSAYDVAAVPRPRIGMEITATQMPNFKESKYVDEELRQLLNMVLEGGNQAMIDSILNNIFNDQMELLAAARVRREAMRMSLLTTGAISIAGNGQALTYDYHLPDNHKGTVTKSWSDPTANIIDDIRAAQETIEDDTGVLPTRSVISRKQWQLMLKNENIRKSVYVFSDGRQTLSDKALRDYIMEQLDLEVLVYSKRYMDENGNSLKFVPDGGMTLFPTGKLGTMWFGTTPEQSDLMTSKKANVAITDVGVAITTTEITDPVTVSTKVSQICLPSYEAYNSVYLLDTEI